MNKLEKPLQNDVAGSRARHKTTQVMVGNVAVGGGAPIVVQSMTNTDTADVEATARQVAALARAGSEFVRITIAYSVKQKALLVTARIREAKERCFFFSFPFLPIKVRVRPLTQSGGNR